MRFLRTDLPEVILIEPDLHRDERGFFLETYHARRYAEAGIPAAFVQDNHSRSCRGTLRGLHAQSRRPQGKLIRVVEGEVFDVAVDLRRGSPRFGRWVGVRLGTAEFRQVYVPPGFAHGFYVTSDCAQVEYKVTEFYDPEDEVAIAWNDPKIAVAWPLVGAGLPVLSAKDRTAPTLGEILHRLPVYEGGRA
jgi:dTDP-4-dehydrorhamnose 3,5-epimerase